MRRNEKKYLNLQVFIFGRLLCRQNPKGWSLLSSQGAAGQAAGQGLGSWGCTQVQPPSALARVQEQQSRSAGFRPVEAKPREVMAVMQAIPTQQPGPSMGQSSDAAPKSGPEAPS